VNFALNNENKVERFTNCQPKSTREPDYKIVGPMKERGGPAGVILKTDIVAQWGDIHRVEDFSVTKVFFYNSRIGNRQGSYKKV
jgi:hypothetical protein